MKIKPAKLPCRVEGCLNLCYLPNIYCGHCGGYEHEMTAAEKRDCLVAAERAQ